LICQTCGITIPNEWKSIILSNLCPVTQDHPIMSEKSKEILDELKEAINQMPSDPDGLSGWIMSNYQLTKIGDVAPVKQFYGPGMNQQHRPGPPGPPIDNFPPQYQPQPFANVNPAFAQIMQNAGMYNPNAPVNPNGQAIIQEREQMKIAAQQLLMKSKVIDDQYGTGSEEDSSGMDHETQEDVEFAKAYFDKTAGGGNFDPPAGFYKGGAPGTTANKGYVALMDHDPNKPPLNNKETVDLQKEIGSAFGLNKDLDELKNIERMKRLTRPGGEAQARYGGRFSKA